MSKSIFFFAKDNLLSYYYLKNVKCRCLKRLRKETETNKHKKIIKKIKKRNELKKNDNKKNNNNTKIKKEVKTRCPHVQNIKILTYKNKH